MVADGEIVKFIQKPIWDNLHWQTFRYSVTNYITAKIKLCQKSPNGPLLSPLGPLNVSIDNKYAFMIKTIVWTTVVCTTRFFYICRPWEFSHGCEFLFIYMPQLQSQILGSRPCRLLLSDLLLQVGVTLTHHVKYVRVACDYWRINNQYDRLIHAQIFG